MAVALTAVTIIAHRFIPPKLFLATPNPSGSHYLHSTLLDDGTPAGVWLDEPRRKFRCVYPENASPTYYCSFNQIHSPSNIKGTDLSGYKKMNVFISYDGPTPKLRFFLRNYDKRYSTPEDGNSTKYNTLHIPEQNLNRETSIQLSQFKVAEWWIIEYNIPIEEAHPDLNNVINMGVDFSDFMSAGNHDVTIEKIEFVGDWISKEKWYLSILCCWLVGLGLYAVNELRLLREKSLRDLSLISSLNKNNALLKKESDKFRRLSTVDPLTQVYNRFGIDQIIAAVIDPGHDVESGSGDYSVILSDIDYFKKINDARGHDAGDRVLKEVAGLIGNNLRSTDYLGRWGGEEFIIVLPATSKESALVTADKIRRLIASTMFEPQAPLTVTASFGVAERQPGEDFSALFKRVDKALYQAKSDGRNGCVLAS